MSFTFMVEGIFYISTIICVSKVYFVKVSGGMYAIMNEVAAAFVCLLATFELRVECLWHIHVTNWSELFNTCRQYSPSQLSIY